MRNVKDIVIAALALTAICAVTVAALAGTNLLTADTIAASEQAATEAACREVLPDAAAFETVDGAFADGVLEVYRAAAADGAVCGYVVKTSTVGKSSGLVVMTGVAADGTVAGVAVVSDSETAGYVDTVTKGGLLSRLKGVTDAQTVDGVSQATKSSNGIKNGVALALETVKEVDIDG